MEGHRNDGLGRCVTPFSHVYYVEEQPTKLSDCSFMARHPRGAAIQRLKARRAGSDAGVGPHRRRG